MNKTMIAALVAVLASSGAFADHGDCEKKAVDKNGKALAGAARASFVKKCEADTHGAAGSGHAACEAKAVDKDGKALAGAAKASFMKKCEADARPKS